MVIALVVVLALAMVAAGSAAVVLGADVIVLERGWAAVIAGSVVASAGTLLFGLALVLRELRRLPAQIEMAQPPLEGYESIKFESEFMTTQSAPAMTTIEAAPVAAAPARAPEMRPAPPAEARNEAPAVPIVETRPPSGTLATAPEVAAAPAVAADSAAPAVAGTYRAGDHTFVMFADGSIKAETPDGSLRFASLKELKAYYAAESGGAGEPEAKASGGSSPSASATAASAKA